MLTETQGDKIHTLSRNMMNAAEFFNDVIGSTPSDEVDQDCLDLLRNLTHTIKTDLQGIELIILNKGAAPSLQPHYLEVDRAQVVDGGGSRPDLKAV